jgi:hypothetical protein
MKKKCVNMMYIMLATVLIGCTNKGGAEKVLKQSGYHPIEVGGYGFFDCSDDDTYRTRFKAYSPDSTMIVEGCVCEGLFKGKTIRLD